MESRENSSHREPLLQMRPGCLWAPLSWSTPLQLSYSYCISLKVWTISMKCVNRAAGLFTPLLISFPSLPKLAYPNTHSLLTLILFLLKCSLIVISNQYQTRHTGFSTYNIIHSVKYYSYSKTALDFVPQQLLKVSSLLNMSSVTFHSYSWVFVMP